MTYFTLVTHAILKILKHIYKCSFQCNKKHVEFICALLLS